MLSILALSCSNPEQKNTTTISSRIKKDSTIRSGADTNSVVKKDTCELEKKLIEKGLVEIHQYIAHAKVDLRYSSAANFMQRDLYGDLERLYVHPNMGIKLKKASAYLKEEDSTLHLLLFDAVRPLAVQQEMWDAVKMPVNKKIKFLSNPAFGSIHNYGAAIDLSLCNNEGKELDMGTAYDDTALLAYPSMEQHFLKLGKLTPQQIKNRALLRRVMYKAGFFGIQSEWWHFNSCTREFAMQNYQRID